MGQVTNGVAKIEFSPIGAGGTVGTSFAAIGLTNLDSVSIAEDEGTTTDFNVEEYDLPLFSRNTPGKTTLTFQIADPDLAALVSLYGGTITGTGSDAVWEMPRNVVALERSVRVTSEIGYNFTWTRMLVKPRQNTGLGKNSLFMIEITADVLMPTDTDTAPVIVGPTVAGGVGVPGTAQTITFGALGSKSIATDSPLTLAATSTSGLPITYYSTDPAKATISGNVATLLTTGAVNIIAIQPGNSTYAAATPVVNALTVTS